MSRQTIKTAASLGVAVFAATNAPAISFTIDEFAGGDSSIAVSINNSGANSVSFHLQITKPTGPSDSDITGVFAHIADESLITQMSLSGVQFNGTPSSAYVFQFGPANSVDEVGGNNNNLNPMENFDFGFYFGSSPGLDSPPINSVGFMLTGTGLNESLFVNQQFGVRIQPLNGNDSAKLSGIVPSAGPDISVPDGGTTLAMLGTALLGLSYLRQRFER